MSYPETHRSSRSIRFSPARASEHTVGVLFAVYLGLLAWTVLWKLHEPFVGRDDMRGIKLVPFVAAEGFGSSAPFEVGMNLLIFVPFGAYLGTLAAGWPVWKRLATISGASIALEVAQFVLASGSSDVTDVIVNTAGGLVGLAVIALARRRLGARTVVVVMRFCLAGTALAVVLVAIHIASFPRLAPISATSCRSALESVCLFST